MEPQPQPLLDMSFDSPIDSHNHYPSPPDDTDADASASYICPLDVTLPAESNDSPDFDESRASSPSDQSTSTAPRKKRKSWGQVLPEPTTNLPPRKRAKTEAEKEQRKYERVQRNRQAAHNSRMRKQEEMDNLSKQNKDLERRCHEQQDEIKRLKRELALFMHGPTTSSGTPPSPTYSNTNTVPSLDSASPSDTSSTDYDRAPTPTFKLEDDAVFDINLDAKQFNESHSAEMCTQQWPLNLPNISKHNVLIKLET